MTAIIDKTLAKYYIDDQLYAEAYLGESDVPHKGYFGFAVYNSERKTIQDVVVT